MKKSDLSVGKIVYDVERAFIGRIASMHEPGEYVSPVNQKPVQEAVVVLSTGDSLVAKDESVEGWSELPAKHEQFYRDCGQATTSLTQAVCVAARQMGISPKLCFLILGRAMMVQGGALLKPAEGEKEDWDR